MDCLETPSLKHPALTFRLAKGYAGRADETECLLFGNRARFFGWVVTRRAWYHRRRH